MRSKFAFRTVETLEDAPVIVFPGAANERRTVASGDFCLDRTTGIVSIEVFDKNVGIWAFEPTGFVKLVK